MVAKNDLTPEEVREMFDYDPSTGVLSWRKPAGRWGRIPAGTVAGWHGGDTRYVQLLVGKKKMWAHRAAFIHYHGKSPEGSVDHINGDIKDNRIANLRDVPHSINSHNHRKARVSNLSSGLLGVSRNHKGWRARIVVDGKEHCLGTFPTPEEAHSAYLKAKRSLHPGCTI